MTLAVGAASRPLGAPETALDARALAVGVPAGEAVAGVVVGAATQEEMTASAAVKAIALT